MRIFNHGFLAGALAGMAVFLLAAGAGAEEPMPGDPWQQEQQQDPQAEMQQIQERLFEIQHRTLNANPELQARLDNLESLAKAAMIDAGYDPDAQIKTMEAAHAALQDETLPEEERLQALDKAREAQQNLQEAEHIAMQDEAVAEAHDAFRNNLLTAMRKEAPELDRLIERFRQIQQGR